MRKSLEDINLDDIFKLQKQATSNAKFSLIVEAIGVAKAVNKQNPKETLRSKKWELLGTGLFKHCMAKGSIVFKFPVNSNGLDELRREYDQWKNPPGIEFRNHLPVTYALIDDIVLIQDRVMASCNRVFNTTSGMNECDQYNTVWDLANRYNLSDFYGNHGHTKNGKIKFFDSVWDRCRKIE